MGKTQADVASATSLSVDQIHKVEKGRANLATLNKVSLAIGLEWVGGIARGPTLGERIKRERTKQGLSVNELAARAGVSAVAVSHVELDRAHIATAEKVLRILAPTIRARILRHKQPTRIRDVRLTPEHFIKQAQYVLGEIDTDPAWHPASFVQPKIAGFTEEDDGLKQDWMGRVWLNPPFTLMAPFVRKAAEQVALGNAEVVLCLLPARVGDTPFQRLADQAHVILLPGRIKFADEHRKPLRYEAPFPMMLMVFGGEGALIDRARKTWPGVYIPARTSPQISDEKFPLNKEF
ncbi:hypothetical protein CH337_22210 [Rhodoblastus acidophilus]|nr:hypothetical protein CKO16_22300 [Rhodoblastus acidophilus]RAI16279.1 hypothetical protein CH337_22210 [Rhodoblastus acidophilus]